MHAGAYVEPTKQTLRDYTADWLAAIEPTIRPATHYSYSRNLRLHVLPQLGSVQLRRIDAGMLNGLYAALLADGKQSNGGGGLSPRSVRYVHTIIHGQCVTLRAGDGFRATLRMRQIYLGQRRRCSQTMRTWTAEQLRAFLDYVADHKLSAAFVVLATTGMRRGECLGLRWSDVDLMAGRISITQTVIAINHDVRIGSPKSARGRRRLPSIPERWLRCASTARIS